MIPIVEQQPHARKIIRAKLCSILWASTFLGRNWFMSRPNPLWLEELPCGLIYFTDETSDSKNTSPRSYLHSLTLTTEVLMNDAVDFLKSPFRVSSANKVDQTPYEGINGARLVGTTEDWLDSRAYEIEHAIAEDKFLGLRGIIQDCKLIRTIPTILKFEGCNDVASIRLYWEINYCSDAFSSKVLDDFLSFMATYNIQLQTVTDEVTINQGD